MRTMDLRVGLSRSDSSKHGGPPTSMTMSLPDPVVDALRRPTDLQPRPRPPALK